MLNPFLLSFLIFVSLAIVFGGQFFIIAAPESALLISFRTLFLELLWLYFVFYLFRKARKSYYDKTFVPLGLIGKSYALGAGRQYEGIINGRKTKIVITRKTKRVIYPAPMVPVAGGTAGVRQYAGETVWITIEAPFNHFVSLVAKSLKGINAYDQMQLNNPITQKIVGGIKDWAMSKDNAKLIPIDSPDLADFDVYSNDEDFAKKIIANEAAKKIALNLLNFKPSFGMSHFAVKPGCVDFRLTTNLSRLSTEQVKEWLDAMNLFIQTAETIN